MSSALDQQCVNTLRFLSVDMVQRANSGHPGLPLDAAPMAYALWTGHMKYNPKDPHWADRDRFVLSPGHGSALLYSLLFMCGYEVSLDDIEHFRQWGSKTPGHPEYGHTPGVEITTGPHGQGLARSAPGAARPPRPVLSGRPAAPGRRGCGRGRVSRGSRGRFPSPGPRY